MTRATPVTDGRRPVPTNRLASLGLVVTSSGLAALLALSHTLTDAVTGTFSALQPTLQARFGLSETALALLVATLTFSTSMTQPFFGALADRLGARTVGLLGMLLSVTLLGLIAAAPRVEVLFGLLLLGGLGSAAFHPAMAGLVRKLAPSNGELAVGLFSAAGTAGMAIGPVVVLSLVAEQGLGLAPWLMVPGVLMGLLLTVVLPGRPATMPEPPRPRRFFEPHLLAGPVGWFSLTGVLSTLAYVTFAHAMPLWLVQAHGLAPDSAVIGWTLAAFSLSAAGGGIAAGLLNRRISARWLIVTSLTLAPLPLWGLFAMAPATPAYYLAVMAAGALVNAGLPLLVVKAQDAAPQAVGAVSGMLMGFTAGAAGLLYVGIGGLQAAWGIGLPMGLSYLALWPAAALAGYALRRQPARLDRPAPPDLASCVCSPCLDVNVAAYPRRSNRAGQPRSGI